MDSKVVGFIDEVVDFVVNNQILVTAFDITLNVKDLLRKSGDFVPSLHRHLHLKDSVHQSFDRYVKMGNYSKSLCNLTINESAWVFHPNHVSPSNYCIDSFNYENELQKANTKSNVQTNVQASSVNKLYFQKPDSRGTVCVPAALLRQIGLGPSDSAYVYFENGVVKVSANPVSGAAVYTVDVSNNVRITQFTLSKYSYVFSSYKFDVENSLMVRLMAG